MRSAGKGAKGEWNPRHQRPRRSVGNRMAMPGLAGLASLVRRRMRVDDRLSAERKWNRFRTRGPKRPDSYPEARVSPGRPKVRRCTGEYFSLSMNLILNPVEKEFQVRRQKIKIKTSEEHAEEALRTYSEENVVGGGGNGPTTISIFLRDKTSGAVPKSSPEGWSPASRFSQAAAHTSFHPQGWKTPDLL